MNKNYFNFWAKRLVKDALRYIKLILGIGLSVSFYITLGLPVAFLFMCWVLTEALIEKE